MENVILYYIPEDRRLNRGFCFLQFDCQKSAAQAKLKMESIKKLWKCKILVDWADPMREPSAEIMSIVKVLYVRNLSTRVSEVQIRQLFEEFGKLERVKKIKDYAFVHFENRKSALRAMKELDGIEIDRITIEVSLAKPPLSSKEKKEILRRKEEHVINLTNLKGR